jgi:phage virion morphogenesis protein
MYKVAVTDRPVLDAMVKLADQADDLAPVMLDISQTMQDSVEESFEQQADPATGTAWQDLSDVTKALREKSGTWPGKMLQISQGGLAPSIQSESGADYAAVGSNKPYARIHHLGGMAGRGRKVEIPARPYLGLWPGHQEEILDIAGEHLRASGAVT